MTRMTTAGLWIAFLACLGFIASGCSVGSYGIGRGIRYATGASTHMHIAVPFDAGLRRYHVIEVRPFQNLVRSGLPANLERYLNDRFLQQLRSLPPSVTVERVDSTRDDAETPEAPATTALALRCDGFIDDFDPGYAWLRLAELGFNHLVVTIRLQCRDRDTRLVIGAASSTARDGRVTASGRGAIDRVLQRAGGFVKAGFAR